MKLLAVGLAAVAATGWHVVARSPSARGMVADVTASATVRHPHGLAVRIAGGAAITGSADVRCVRGRLKRSATTRYVGRFATLKLPLQQPAVCAVAARATGTGQLTLEILAR